MIISKTLSFYKRTDIREEMIRQADHKEVAVRFGDRGFGKRPDVLKYPQDILELAQKSATSFHCSEELWKNPLLITTDMKKNEVESLRVGWDLILDIDCPVWEFSRMIASFFIKALRDHGIGSVTCKFSGNKGFHIAVPWEAFPETIAGSDVKDLFPEAPRRIANYLLSYISSNYIKVLDEESIMFHNRRYSLAELSSLFSKETSELVTRSCKKCGVIDSRVAGKSFEFFCPKGHFSTKSEVEEMACPKCGSLMERREIRKRLCSCGSGAVIETRFNALSIVDVDTILISSRHLYRMPYSLHEKSMLVSVPLNPDDVALFEKVKAQPEKAVVRFPFLDRKDVVKGEAARLLSAAYDFSPQVQQEDRHFSEKEFQIPEEAVPESCFPPCILKGLKGLEDGKKRFLFILTNFLYSCGWGYEQVEKVVLEWNSRNREPLRDSYITGHLRHAKQAKKKMLPPNCSAQGYYKDLGLCTPEIGHLKVKNPVQYAVKMFNARKSGRGRAVKAKAVKKERKKKTRKEPGDTNSK